MIKGIGVDVIEIDRIKQSWQKYEQRFTERLFTDRETNYCLEKARPEVHFAARFAAKEAVVKALGTGLRQMKWTDIEVNNDELGKPMINLYNKAKESAQDLEIEEILITLSHAKEYAVAQAVALSEKANL